MNDTQIDAVHCGHWPAGETELIRLLRARDWAGTTLGPIESWPPSLRTVVDLVLASPIPMVVLWGPELVQIYNDGYRVIMGGKHPSGLGQPTRECWPEVWHFNAPVYEAVFRGEARSFTDQKLVIERRGVPESAWFDLTFIPIREGTGAVAGVLVTVLETTRRHMAEEAEVASERALRESEMRFRNMADHAPVMTWVTNPTGACIYLSRRWYEFTGQSEVEALGSGWLNATHPEDQQRSADVFSAANAKQEAFRLEYRLRRFDGTYRWAMDAASPRFGPGGEFLGYVGTVIDIDERRKAEERLRASEARFRILTETVPAIVWFASPDGQVHYLNSRWYEYTGQAPETALPSGWAEALHPEDAERTAALWAEVRASGVAYEVEMRYRRHDGTYRWYVARAEPVRDETGAITAWFGTSTDIHDHKVAEERLRLVQRAARIGSFDFDNETGRVTCSPEYLELYGLPGDRPMGLSYPEWLAFIHEDDREWIHAETQAATADPNRTWLDYEFRILRADTSEMRWLASRTQLHRDKDGKLVRSVGAQWDQTERRVAEEELRASEAQLADERGRLATLVEHLPVGVNFLSLDGRTLLSNPAFRTFVPSEVIPSRLPNGDERWTAWDETGARLPRDRFPGARALRGDTVSGVEFLHRRSDGREVWAQVSGVPLRDSSGQLSGALAVIVDIDEQKRAQEALQRLNETLEARVEERSRELLVAEEALRQAQKMEAIGQLTGGVAHDFNNLLTIIRSSVDFLRRRELPEERRRRYVDAIADTVERASKLTGQLLAFARRQALKPEVFDVQDRVRAVVEMMRTMVGSRIQIAMDLDCERCFVEADVSQFETALLNIAVNARDAMDGEGVLNIGVRTLPEMPPIRRHAGSRESFVAVSVTDNGTGISPDQLTHIFEPFFTTKEVGKGTGLGLSQVYGFAKQSGGDVAVESELGRGTTFTLFLPQVEAGPENAVAQSGGESSVEDGRGRRILVVEDNVDVGTFSTQLLQDLGYETIWAASAGEALSYLSETSDFDVVFTDVVMPGMGGVDLAREVRHRYPQIPVVLTSGYSHVLAEEGRHGFELLQKPYAAEELSRVLRRAMRRHRREY